MIVGTAGHIDHGKTALVKALTGVDADRLKEEKARGITIDLGFAYSDLGDGRQLGFVDVPGHERFVHNMLAGASGIDSALLVVSAAEGIMPQTVEHLQILDLLGLDRGIVALTKSDLVNDDELLERMAEVETLLASTSLKGAEIIPVSAMTGAGIDELKAKLLALGESGKGATGFARLAVDRCFVLPGAGVVVTGTVHAGEIKVGDHLLLTPSGLEARVRSLHAQNRAAEVGRAGERCALNLSGARLSKESVRRGDWVVSPELHAPTDRIDVRLKVLASEKQPLKHWAPVHVHLGAAHVMGRVALLDGDRLAPGAEGLAQLVLEEKVGALAGDRVILRDPVGHAHDRRRRGDRSLRPAAQSAPPRRLAELRALREPNDERAGRGAAAGGGLRRPGALRPRPQSQAGRGRAAAGRGGRRQAGGLRLSRRDARGGARRHRGHAEGLPRQQCRCARPAARAAACGDEEALAAAGLRARCSITKCGQDGHGRRLVSAPARPFADARREGRGAVEEDLGRAGARPLQAAAGARFRRGLRDARSHVRKLLRRLAKLGRVVEVAPDQFFLRPVVAEMIAIAHGLGRDFTAAQFRDKLDNGRKLAILILEFFDRHGITIRRGDLRRTVPQKLRQYGPAPSPAATDAVISSRFSAFRFAD